MSIVLFSSVRPSLWSTWSQLLQSFLCPPSPGNIFLLWSYQLVSGLQTSTVTKNSNQEVSNRGCLTLLWQRVAVLVMWEYLYLTDASLVSFYCRMLNIKHSSGVCCCFYSLSLYKEESSSRTLIQHQTIIQRPKWRWLEVVLLTLLHETGSCSSLSFCGFWRTLWSKCIFMSEPNVPAFARDTFQVSPGGSGAWTRRQAALGALYRACLSPVTAQSLDHRGHVVLLLSSVTNALEAPEQNVPEMIPAITSRTSPTN